MRFLIGMAVALLVSGPGLSGCAALKPAPRTFEVTLEVDFGPVGRPPIHQRVPVRQGATAEAAAAQVCALGKGAICCDSREVTAIEGVAADPAANRWWTVSINGSKKVSPYKTKLKPGDLVRWEYRQAGTRAAEIRSPIFPEGPAGERVLDQKGSQFVPRRVVVPPGGRLIIRNSDPIQHNVRIFKEGSPSLMMHRWQKAGGPEIVWRFPEPGRYLVRCGIHPWMYAWVVVEETPPPPLALKRRAVPPISSYNSLEQEGP